MRTDSAAAALVLTSVLLSGSRTGWWLVGLYFAGLGAVMPVLSAWASSTRGRTAPATGGPP